MNKSLFNVYTRVLSLIRNSLVIFDNRWTAWGTLAVSLVITIIVWHSTNRYFEIRNRERLQFRTSQISDRIADRMQMYEQVLRGGVGLYQASDSVTRGEWHEYVEACEVQEYYPGIQAMAVATVVAKDDLAMHVEEVRREGFPEYQVYPEGERETYTSIIYLEPFDWRNQRAFGYDMYSEPVRREAMDRASQSGVTSISGKITLVQETDEDVQAGVLCYLPLYVPDGDPADNEMGEKKLSGWIYAAFRFHDLMNGILGDDITDVDFAIYDMSASLSENLLFQSDGGPDVTYDSQYSTSVMIEVFGRQWDIIFETRPAFFATSESTIGWLVGIGGILFDLLIFTVIVSVRFQRQVALHQAGQIKLEFEEAETRHRLILENASEAILSVTEDGQITAANSASHAVFRANDSLVGSSILELSPGLCLKSVFDQHAGNELAVTCRRTDGSEFPGHVSVGCLEVDRRVDYIVILRDETARIELERDRDEANKKLVLASHDAGRAEVATGVLHNVGNVLNSVNVSAFLLRDRISSNSVRSLSRASEIIDDHASNLADFLENDPRGVHFPELLKQLAANFERDQSEQLNELESLTTNIEHIKQIVSMQQSFAKKAVVNIHVNPSELFEEAIMLSDSSLSHDRVKLVREFSDSPDVSVDKHGVLQILVNLVRNAHQAVASNTTTKMIRFSTSLEDDFILFRVQDNGVGISEENLSRVFQRGFTTKEDGHGFGLHSCGNAAQEMGGELMAESDGVGAGATFVLKIPGVGAEACAVSQV